jgi:hypothetical protein
MPSPTEEPVANATPGLAPERKLADPTEMLLRQIHPSWIHDGRVASQAFRPTPKDEGLLSVSRGTLTSPESAFRLHTEVKRLPSVGVWGVSVAEAGLAKLVAYADPETGAVEDPAHAVVDFRPLGSNAAERASKILAAKARERGPLFEPPRAISPEQPKP